MNFLLKFKASANHQRLREKLPESWKKTRKKINGLKQRPLEVFSVCMNLVTFETEISCVWSSLLKTGSPCTIPFHLTAFQSWIHVLATTTPRWPRYHPRKIHLAASSSPCVPQAARSPSADGSRSCSIFPRGQEVQTGSPAMLSIAELWTMASWLAVSTQSKHCPRLRWLQ